MVDEIEFSINANSSEGIQPLLDKFEAEHNIRVKLRLLSWDQAWSVLLKAALYNDGPDISEIGTTWIGDLVGMHALRSFNTAEVVSLGKADAFFPSAWNTATQLGDSHVWAIPWLVGSRLIYYRKPLCGRAGVDPQVAFHSSSHFPAALDRLQATGVRVPWTVPTGLTHTTLLNAASWVWEAGGDFVSSDGSTTRFMEPNAMAGLREYFSLGRFLAPEVRHLNGLEPDEFFLFNQETAVTISGPWLFCQARQRFGEDLVQEIGVALPPGASFVGGSNLIIWKYSRNPEAAIKLIRFLTHPSALAPYSQYIGLLPARMSTLAAAPFATNPFWKTTIAGLETGRMFPSFRLWGLVEDRLTTAFRAIWAELLVDFNLDPEIPLVKHLGPLAKRLNPLLKQG